MNDLQGTRALITGGAGVVGSTIADHLVRAGAAEILVLDNFSRGRRENLAWAMANGPVRVVTGDVRDAELVHKTVAGKDVVFHQAAIRITQCAEDPRLAHEVLGTGTLNVALAVAHAGVPRLVAASSASVYGQATVFPTPEDHHPWGNQTLYGAAKAYGEGILRSLHSVHDLSFVALRYFNVYGPRMDVHGLYTEVMVRWMERIARGLPPVVLGDGAQTMDFVYVDDVARANLLAAVAPVSNQAFNVASGTETSLLGLARCLNRAMGTNLGVEFGPERHIEVRRRLGDTSNAKRLLGFEAEVDLEQGLRRLVSWWRDEQGRAA